MSKTRRSVYKTLQGLRKQMLWGVLTAENMANKRAAFTDSRYYDFKVTEEVEDEFWDGVAHVVWKHPSEHQICRLKDAKSWMLNRLHFESDGRFTYCAGQDYPGEIRMIQNYVNKL